jgi:hypothetical protein
MHCLWLLILDLAFHAIRPAPGLHTPTCCSCCASIVDACMTSARNPLSANRGAALGQSDTTSFTRLGGRTCAQTTVEAQLVECSFRIQTMHKCCALIE